MGDGSPVAITGAESLGWVQSASDAVELSTFHYAIYVDSVRSELAGVSCDSSSTTDFNCAAPLPRMTLGNHSLQLASFTISGTTVAESTPSAALAVNVVATGAGVLQPSDSWPRQTLALADGVRLRLEQIPGQVALPTDAAFAPDARVFVAERDGRVRVVRDGQVLTTPAVSLQDSGATGAHLLGLAVDPDFAHNHFVYAVFTTPVTTGGRAFTISRFREAGDTLAEQVVLLDRIPSSSVGEGASLRFGPDGKLFAALDDGGSASAAGDLASPNGKILRLNTDGSTPSDQASGSPLYSYPYRSPHGLDWCGTGRVLWFADRNTISSGRLVAVAPGSDTSRQRGVVSATYTLPRGTLPSSMAFGRQTSIAGLRDNLLVASDEGRQLYRLQFDPANPTRVTASERLLEDQIGGIRVIATSPDGVIYLGTAGAFGKLVAGD
jgi:glucose/arabinose dehydrogenase